MHAWLHSFDKRYTKRIQSWPEGVRGIMLLATLVGQPIFTLGTAILIAGIGYGKGSGSLFYAGLLAAGTLGVGTILKLTLRRKRPITEYVLTMRFDTFSLPSGHAVGAVASYGLLMLLSWSAFSFLAAFFVSILSIGVMLLIGLSRVYLGAHYPSDVIVGWLVGSAGLIVIGTVLHT